jgi:hypothetical protein
MPDTEDTREPQRHRKLLEPFLRLSLGTWTRKLK